MASRRGALPEVLDKAGFLFDLPPQYAPETRVAPTADEVAPWIETIVRLGDDREWYERERQRALAASKAWRPEILAAEHDAFFERVLRDQRL